MKWEVPLLLGFLLFFSIWISLPVTNNYYFDANSIKHYILVPAAFSYHNDVDNLTNILFIKYENPWDTQSEIAIPLFTGIFVLLLIHESVQLYLRYKILTSLKFNLLKYFGRTLNKSSNLKTTQKQYDNYNSELTHSFNYSLFKIHKLKKSTKVFSIIFSLLILFSFYSVFVYIVTMTKIIIFSSAFSSPEIKIRNSIAKLLPLQVMVV